MSRVKVFLRQRWKFFILRRQLIAKALFLVLWPGCGQSREAETNSPAAIPTVEPRSVRREANAPRADSPDGIYNLKPTGVDSYHAGKVAKFSVVLTSRGEYHINQEYPTAVTLKAPAEISLPRNRFLKADAAEFSEKLARFEILFTPAKAGVYQAEVRASFAMCTSKICIPLDKTLAVTLSVD